MSRSRRMAPSSAALVLRHYISGVYQQALTSRSNRNAPRMPLTACLFWTAPYAGLLGQASLFYTAVCCAMQSCCETSAAITHKWFCLPGPSSVSSYIIVSSRLFSAGLGFLQQTWTACQSVLRRGLAQLADIPKCTLCQGDLCVAPCKTCKSATAARPHSLFSQNYAWTLVWRRRLHKTCSCAIYRVWFEEWSPPYTCTRTLKGLPSHACGALSLCM